MKDGSVKSDMEFNSSNHLVLTNKVDGGFMKFNVYDSTTEKTPLSLRHNQVDITAPTVNVAGNLAVTGTVDGVDVAALDTTVSSLDTTVTSINTTISNGVVTKTGNHTMSGNLGVGGAASGSFTLNVTGDINFTGDLLYQNGVNFTTEVAVEAEW